MVILNFRTDIKCSPPCWFCKHRCLVCLQPALLTTTVNGEDILHCSDPCLQIVFKNPGIIHILPPGFEIVNSPEAGQSKIKLPTGHRVLIHTCHDYRRKDGRCGQYVLMLCMNKKGIDAQPYILYHQFNSLCQLTFGFLISYHSFDPGTPLAPLNEQDLLQCLKLKRNLLAIEPIGKTLQNLLIEQGVSTLSPDTA